MKRYIVIFVFLHIIVSSVIPHTVLPPGVNVVHETLLHLGITDSPVDWKYAFVLLAEEYKTVYGDLRKELLLSSIRTKIEFWVDMLNPNYKFVGKQDDNIAYMNFHKERWTWIMEHSCSDPIVKKMNEFIKNDLNNDTDLFCTKIAGFFTHRSRSERIPPLRGYSIEEVDEIMRYKFGIYDDAALKIVHFFRKI